MKTTKLLNSKIQDCEDSKIQMMISILARSPFLKVLNDVTMYGKNSHVCSSVRSLGNQILSLQVPVMRKCWISATTSGFQIFTFISQFNIMISVLIHIFFIGWKWCFTLTINFGKRTYNEVSYICLKPECMGLNKCSILRYSAVDKSWWLWQICISQTQSQVGVSKITNLQHRATAERKSKHQEMLFPSVIQASAQYCILHQAELFSMVNHLRCWNILHFLGWVGSDHYWYAEST